MIVALDPALFVARPMGAAGESALRDDLKAMLGFLKVTGARLIAADDYWLPLWQELIEPLICNFPRLMGDFAQLRKAGLPRSLLPFDGPHRIWGFVPMFHQPHLSLDHSWPDRMARAMIRMHLSLGEPIVLFVRPVQGRNIMRHGAGHSVIDETTRWRLYIQPRTAEPVAISCVTRPRNLEVPWTARFDARLPGAEDGARYPFCPPARWWKRPVPAVGTHTSKPAFIDACGCGWARPNIPSGAGYHWDVFVSERTRAHRIGLDQINVVEHGAPPSEGEPGSLHHVPQDKKHVVHDCGWRCPAMT